MPPPKGDTVRGSQIGSKPVEFRLRNLNAQWLTNSDSDGKLVMTFLFDTRQRPEMQGSESRQSLHPFSEEAALSDSPGPSVRVFHDASPHCVAAASLLPKWLRKRESEMPQALRVCESRICGRISNDRATSLVHGESVSRKLPMPAGTELTLLKHLRAE
jgi:hypothetical protein